MQFLRQNTAVIVTVGPFYDKTDGVTIKGSLTITNERISLTADTDAGSAPTNILDNVTGATSATANDLNYITGTDAGLMQLELAAADTNRVGRMFLSITDAANHVPVFHEYFVLPQAIFDWFTGVIVPLPANVTQLLGTAWLTPGTAGTPDVNTKLLGGTSQTGRDVGASVLLSAGSGTGQLDFTSGVVKANLAQILGTALTETAGLLAGGFKKFFNIATPASTMDVLARVTLTDTVTTYTGNTVQTGDSFARIGVAGAGLTNIDLPDQTMNVTGNITGNLSGSVGSLTTNNDKTGYAVGVGGIASTAFAAGAIDAAAIATDAIGAAELAQGAAQEIADEVLDRNLAGGGSGNTRNVRNALRTLRNKVDIAAGTATIYQEDDTTSAWMAAITTAAGNPITTVDPA